MKIEKTLKVKLKKSELKTLNEASNIIGMICDEYTECDCEGCPFYTACKNVPDNIYIILTDGISQIPSVEEEE